MKIINTKFITLILTMLVLVRGIFAQDLTANYADNVDAGGLDLYAVAEVFKDSGNLEDFEKNLNDSDGGINNLDLDENGEVDYLRVEEEIVDDTHLIVLQSVLGETEFEDVATIAVEKEINNFNMQVQGSPAIYGANYYVVPSYRTLGTWNLIKWLFRPNYRPYRSAFGWRIYPSYWRVRRPVTVSIYRTRTLRYVGRKNFTPSKTIRVKSVTKVKYQPRTSKLVKKKRVVRTNGNKTVVTKTGVKKTTNAKTGTTTVSKGKKTKVKTKNGTKTKTKKVTKKKKTN